MVFRKTFYKDFIEKSKAGMDEGAFIMQVIWT